MLQPLGAARLGSLGRSASATSRSCSLPQRLSTAAAFKWKRAEPTKDESAKEQNIGLTGLKQLVGMGLGTMVGELKEINLDDPARTVVLELEANNFEDAEGNPLALKSMNNEVSSLCMMLFLALT